MLDLLRDIESELEGDPEAASRGERWNAEPTRRSVARVARALWITVALLLVFSSDRLEEWVNGFEVGPVQNAVVALSSTWNTQMTKNGFDMPAAGVRSEVNELRTTSWTQVRQRFDNERARTSEGAKLLRGMLNDRQG
ncbi:MAG: hypothetical protein RH982_16955 [Parvibaculum sp.]